jgi:hypothetical protein
MRISLISAACIFALGCGSATPRPNVNPSTACQGVAAIETHQAQGAVQGQLVIDAKAIAAVTTPENVADVARALDTLLQASRGCSTHRLLEHA